MDTQSQTPAEIIAALTDKLATVEAENRRLVARRHFFAEPRVAANPERGEKTSIEAPQKWQDIIISIPQICVSLDQEARITFANSFFLRLVDWQKEDVIGKNWFELFIPSHLQQRVQDVFVKNMQKGEICDFSTYENELLTRTGEIRIVSWYNTTNKDFCGNILETTCLGVDITAQRQAERALTQSEAHLRTLVQNIPDMVWLKDTNGFYLDCNPVFERFFGAARKDIIGKTDYDFVDHEMAHEFRENDRKALELGGYISKEIWYTFATGGHKVLYHTIKTPMVDGEGHVIGVLGIGRDVTERKKTEQALHASLAEKEVLLREVHHRVKNNMAAIIGLFSVQRQAMTDPQARTILAELSSRVRAMSLVHEKLYLSESLAHIDFQDYIQALVSHLHTSFKSPTVRWEIEALGVKMPLDLAVPCGMLINELVTNAFKYAFARRESATGKPDHLLIALSHNRGTYRLTVADNGPGLPPGFDLQSAKTIGMVLIRMLGEHQLGGHYHIDQTGGTRFTLTFTARDS